MSVLKSAKYFHLVPCPVRVGSINANLSEDGFRKGWHLHDTHPMVKEAIHCPNEVTLMRGCMGLCAGADGPEAVRSVLVRGGVHAEVWTGQGGADSIQHVACRQHADVWTGQGGTGSMQQTACSMQTACRSVDWSRWDRQHADIMQLADSMQHADSMQKCRLG